MFFVVVVVDQTFAESWHQQLVAILGVLANRFELKPDLVHPFVLPYQPPVEAFGSIFRGP